MSTLIERLEKAQKPSMELSRLVAKAIGWVRLLPSDFRPKGGWVRPEDTRAGQAVFCSLHGTDVWREPPHFTASIDATLKLESDPTKAYSRLRNAIVAVGNRHDLHMKFFKGDDLQFEVCREFLIACLRARTSEGGER